MNKQSRLSILGRIALLLAVIIWGSSFFILKNTLDAASVPFVLSFRFLSAALLLSLIFIKQWKHFNTETLKKGAFVGVILACAYLAQTYGLKGTTPSNNAFLTAVHCVFVPFLQWLIFRKKPDGYNYAAAFICIVGIGLVSLTDSLTVGLGDALTLLGGLCFGFQIIFVARSAKCNLALFTVVQFFVAGLVFFLLWLITDRTVPVGMSGSGWLGLGFLALFATAGAYLLQNFGQRYLSASAASIYLSLEACFGVLFSVLFYSDRLTPRLAFGFALIFVAVIVTETKLEFLYRHPYRVTEEMKQRSQWLLTAPMVHRGYHEDGAAENSLSSFRAACEKGCNVELDVRLTRDGQVVVFHDPDTMRMCGRFGIVRLMKLSTLQKLRLKGTQDTIPTLQEVLAVTQGEIGLIIELKNYPLTHKALCHHLKTILDGYNGNFSVHSFSSITMRWFAKNCPDYTRGIAGCDFRALGFIGLYGLWLNRFGCLSAAAPSFIMYNCMHLKSPFVKMARECGLTVLCWTVRSPETLQKVKPLCDNVLCEGEAGKIITGQNECKAETDTTGQAKHEAETDATGQE